MLDASSWTPRLYELMAKQDRVPVPKYHVGSVNSLSIDTTANRYLLSGGGDSSIRLWDLDETVNNKDSGSKAVSLVAEIPRREGHAFGVSCIMWWPFDNGMFVTGSYDHSVKVWDPNAMAEVYKFDLGTKVYNLDVSSTGGHSLVATASDHPFVRLLDLRSTSSAHTLTTTAGRVLSVKWSPKDVHIVASAGSDGTVKLWDIRRSSACVCSFDMHQTDDSTTATPLLDRRAHRSAANGLQWLPSGRHLLSCGHDEKIMLWSLAPNGGKNMLVNFGPLLRNRLLQTRDPCLSPPEDLPQPYMFFPSDSGEIFVHQAVDGRLVKRLNRGVSSSSRSACIIARGASTLEYYAGTMDGQIVRWAPSLPIVEEEDAEDADLGPVKKDVLDEIWRSITYH